MSIGQTLMAEIEQEAATTKRVLERVPEDKMTWKPHDKSMSLGQLALHIATAPGVVVELVANDTFSAENIPPPPSPSSTGEVLAAFEASQAKIRDYLSGLSDEAAMSIWNMMAGDKAIWTAPRSALVRVIAMNHVYHHRGQLSVYLRMLDVPVPSIYGPSADEQMPM